MTIDPRLLAHARAAAADLEAADRAALLARAEYHTAIRRMHLAGASQRELAAALGLSHQRVQQVVSSSGGSWWRRVWRSRRLPPDAACTWCGRPPSEVAKLIAGPRVYICDGCVDAAELAARGSQAPPFHRPADGIGTASCAFCGKRGKKSRPLVRSASGHVCADCLRACREILDRASAPA